MPSERSLDHRAAPGALAAPDAASRGVDGGRLGVYAAICGAVGTVPLPWVPAALARRVRGALVHDVVTRHGLSLSMEARDALADPRGPDDASTPVSRALNFAGKRLAFRALTRIGPLRALWPLGQALQVYALGALLDRYMARHRRTETEGPRIERAEALRVRRAIDDAMAHVLDAGPTGGAAQAEVDDPRDRVTALVDGLLGTAAGLPGHLMGRLETAFDRLIVGGR